MEEIAAVFALLVISALFLVFVFTLLLLIFSPLQGYMRPGYLYLRYTLFPNLNPPGFELYCRLLYEKFPYFALLNDREQRVFVNRLRYIRNRKTFRSRDEGLVFTEEMEILLSAAITQLTFGLTKFDLENLTDIQLTASSFYSRIVGRDVKGLTFERGRIILSWADFQEGYRISNDKLNLGLHELAHSLWISHFKDSDLTAYFDEWNVVALRELQSIRLGTDSDFLRDYAATNIEEFWACSVECFFEAPVEFRNKISDLYSKMVQVLNQDMAERMKNKVI